MPDPITDTSEDCELTVRTIADLSYVVGLTINVVKPTQDSRAKLPVVVVRFFCGVYMIELSWPC